MIGLLLALDDQAPGGAVGVVAGDGRPEEPVVVPALLRVGVALQAVLGVLRRAAGAGDAHSALAGRLVAVTGRVEDGREGIGRRQAIVPAAGVVAVVDAVARLGDGRERSDESGGGSETHCDGLKGRCLWMCFWFFGRW